MLFIFSKGEIEVQSYKTAAYVLVSQLAEEAKALANQVSKDGPRSGKETITEYKRKKHRIELVASDLSSIIEDAGRFKMVNEYVAKQFSNYVNYNRDFLIELLEKQLRIEEDGLCGVLLVVAKQKKEAEAIQDEDGDTTEVRKVFEKRINYFA